MDNRPKQPDMTGIYQDNHVQQENISAGKSIKQKNRTILLTGGVITLCFVLVLFFVGSLVVNFAGSIFNLATTASNSDPDTFANDFTDEFDSYFDDESDSENSTAFVDGKSLGGLSFSIPSGWVDLNDSPAAHAFTNDNTYFVVQYLGTSDFITTYTPEEYADALANRLVNELAIFGDARLHQGNYAIHATGSDGALILKYTLIGKNTLDSSHSKTSDGTFYSIIVENGQGAYETYYALLTGGAGDFDAHRDDIDTIANSLRVRPMFSDEAERLNQEYDEFMGDAA